MSDAASTFASAWTYRGLTLPQLKVSDYGILERSARERARNNLIALLEDVKADMPNKIALLKEFDRRLPRLSDTASHLETAEGARQAVTLSLVRSGMSETEAKAKVEDIAIADLTQLAMKVSTLDMIFPNPVGMKTAGDLVVAAGEDDGKKPAGV